MSGQVLLVLPAGVQKAIWQHLVPERHLVEEAAFVYATRETHNQSELFRYTEWVPVESEGFASRSAYHLELTDTARAGAIKRAHDLGASLIELHSHTGRWPAAFSPSDLAGFRDFVPHVWWRLKRRPYAAIVVTRSGFDGLVWLAAPTAAQPLDGIQVEDQLLKPTGLSRRETDGDE